MSKKDKNKETEQPAEGINDTSQLNEQKESQETINEALTELQEEFQKEKDRFLRLYAEFENFKKRTARERIEMFRTASEDVMLALLPILDDFGRALKELEKSSDDGLFKGVELINNKFKETLRNKGLEEIEVKQGDSFDPETHEAITQIPAPEEKLKGKIIEAVEKGYRLGDKIIRYPKVVIGQ